MALINKVQLPNGNIYDIEDNDARKLIVKNGTGAVIGGKNLLNEGTYGDKIVNANGAIRKGYDISLKSGTYTVSRSATNVNWWLTYVQNGNWIQTNLNLQSNASATITISTDIVGVIRTDSADASAYISNLQVEEGSTATAYEPYFESNYKLTIDVSAIKKLSGEPTLYVPTGNAVENYLSGRCFYTITGHTVTICGQMMLKSNASSGGSSQIVKSTDIGGLVPYKDTQFGLAFGANGSILRLVFTPSNGIQLESLTGTFPSGVYVYFSHTFII